MNNWKSLKLSEIIVEIESGSRPKGGIEIIKNSEGVPSYGGENILLNGGMCFKNIRYVKKDFANQMKKGVLRGGEILMNKDGAQTGKVAIYAKPLSEKISTINEHLFLLRSNEAVVDNFFLYHFLNSQKGKDQIWKIISGSAQPGLNSKFINFIEIGVPSLTEQKKIVEILNSIDVVINSYKEKEKTYKNLLQSMINELTTSESSPFYKVRKFGDIVENSRKKTNSHFPIYSITIDSGMVPRNQLGRSVISDLKNEGYLYAAKGDFCYNMMRMWQGAAGVAPIDCLVSPAYVVCKPLSEVLPEYLGLICESSYSIDQFKRSSRGITSDRWRLYFDDFSKIKVSIPSLEKQQEILDIINNQKHLLKELQKKYQLLMHLKSSLMNNLLTGLQKVGV